MKRSFTLVMAYYDNAGMLDEHIRIWGAYPKEILENLHVVIVDDASPREPAQDHWHAGALRMPASRRLFRMEHDIPWNQDACRNIGVREATTEWVVLTDMDHVVPATTWRELMSGKLNEEIAYRFARVTAPHMTPYKYHPNTWTMTRDLYWRIGGYDEALAGNYGTDGDFLRRTMGKAEVYDLKQHVIRYPREVIADASTTTLERKRPEQKQAISALIAARRTNPKWKPLHFSFPYRRVL